jgi:acyl transferase domain-containing protein
MAAAYAAGRVTLEEAIVAAYYRGKSVARITREGSMAALGLTPNDCETLLEPLKDRVSIAAINSPESITVSGDTDAIQEVSNICNSKGIFNRVLSTGGKAYHSFHMREIGEIFETSTRQAMSHIYQEEGRRAVTPFFSSVSGHRLPEGSQITPSYWRSDLEGPVLFSPALEELVNYGVDLIVEIGPHSALAGPIRQLEQAFRGKEKVFPPYMPTLVRKRDAEECMLELAGALFNEACKLNIGAVNCAVEAATGKEITPRLLSSLPTYRYAYGDSLQHMSRIETEFRFPQFSFHNLLGSRVLGASPRAPSWRNVINSDSAQDVGGLRVLQTAQIPVACLLEMVLVAAQQTVPSISARTWTFTNIQLPNALTLEVEKDVVTCLYPNVDEGSYLFEITSIQGREAIVHAAGQIHAKQDQPIQGNILDGRITPITISAAKLYKKLEATGLQYDVSWQSIETVHANPLENVYRYELRETSLSRLGTLETCIQLAIMSSVTHQQTHDLQLAYPVSIGEVVITGFWDNLDMSTPYLASTIQSRDVVKTVDLWDTNSQLAICLKDVRLNHLDCRIIKPTEYPALQSISKPDYSTISQDSISGIFPAPVFPGERTFTKVHRLASAVVVQYISSQTESSSNKTSESLSETGRNFFDWLENAYAQIPNGSMPYGQELAAMDGPARSKLISTLYEEVYQDSVEAQLMMRMYTNLSCVLDGTVSAHDLLMVDGLLHKLYTSTLTAAGSMIQLRRVIDLVGHKDPSARYLEIGGGTRGATREILDVLGAWGGARRYGSYCFTDVSSYFLSGARDEFQDCQDISYATLNIEEAPSKQGIEEASYDVVVAANVFVPWLLV